ncbi:MAG TPA: 30S ribosomal protein S6 [Terriglobales bacterium]|nr:30S ribosomal protein S6 [Terriglobales bacterium]
MRTYEVMFIVRPDMADEDLDRLISTLEGNITTAGGTVKNIERMGKRRLAYTVRKFNDGIYVLFTVDGEGKLIAEVERRLRVAEPVIKFITVRTDEEQKRLDKVKKIRESRQRGRGAQAAAAAQQQAEAQAAGPETAPAAV